MSFSKGHKTWNKGKKLPEWYRQKLSKAHLGQIAWNKGLTVKDPRVKSCVEKRIRRIIKTCKVCGKIIEVKVCLQYRKKYCSFKCRNKGLKGKISWNKGKSFKPLEQHWKGGISKEPYPFNFDNALKELIRKRDNYKCQRCFRIQEKEKLSIHHKDKNKNNLNPGNLISLCRSCHTKTHNGGKYEEIANNIFGIVNNPKNSVSCCSSYIHKRNGAQAPLIEQSISA